MTKAVPGLLRYQQYWNCHEFPELNLQGLLLSHSWSSPAVNRLDGLFIDRCDGKSLLFEKKTSSCKNDLWLQTS